MKSLENYLYQVSWLKAKPDKQIQLQIQTEALVNVITRLYLQTEKYNYKNVNYDAR